VRSSALDVEAVVAEDARERLAGRRRLDDYLREFPELRASGEALTGARPGERRSGVPLDLVAEEYLVRRRFGDRPTHAEFMTRYASQATEVATMLAEVDRQFVEAGDDSVDVRGDLGTLVDSVAIDRGHVTIDDEKMPTWGEHGEASAVDGSHAESPSGSHSGSHADSRADSAGFATPMPDERPPLVRFVARLRESRILSPARCDEIAAEAERFAEPDNVKSFAASLVAAGRMTDYQADSLLRGDGRRLVLGEYVVLSKIGEGGMGAVYRARHRRMDRVVALKVLSRSSTRSREALQRFLREARTAGRLSHPNIVLALDASEDSGRHYLVMEYVDGVNVRQIVKRRGPMKPAEALAIARQVAEGLAAAHAANIIHRDIKPDNVLVGAGGVAKVLDLGLARLNEETPREFATLTGTGSIVGTPEFMSPEQAADPRHVDLRADVYGLGCTLYYMLTGKPPYEAEGVFEKLMAHRDRPVPSVRVVRSDVSREVDQLIARMMAKDPGERPQSMGEVCVLIDAALADMHRRDAVRIAAESAATAQASDALEPELLETPLRKRMRDWIVLATLVSCVVMLIVRLVLIAR
jgi:tRNA A-37 threonylcarbamoyl transferase component Bud32